MGIDVFCPHIYFQSTNFLDYYQHTESKSHMTLPADYENRVYAGWLGKCIGVRFGAPLENWTYDEIRRHLGDLKTYVREDQDKIFKPDDDTSVPMIFQQSIPRISI